MKYRYKGDQGHLSIFFCRYNFSDNADVKTYVYINKQLAFSYRVSSFALFMYNMCCFLSRQMSSVLTPYMYITISYIKPSYVLDTSLSVARIFFTTSSRNNIEFWPKLEVLR